ncbi:hypothetical protein SEA_GARDENSTATE_28 [Microbacterium phage GardenState]|uniref:Uncharacterized protein n=2 Tax=Gardenstatevirus TaxID=3425012 RepID=A0A4Y6E7S6_9CAUD|nr:hypothetical protein SEA_IAMGROOT_28 [Microbacterium phage IAmGroot]QOI66940.1 hypothetical protein SEA_GARDENSTATE_28 [Microbacterium phage GardenState]
MTPLAPSLEAIRTRAADAMRGYVDHEGAERTLFAKDAARALIDSRLHFQTRDGETDLLGRSREYRQFVTACLDEAAIPRDDRASLQAAIRYHISPLIRERFPEEVAALGLEPGSTVERARRRKERDARILSLFAGGSEVDDPADVSLVLNLSRLALSRLTAPVDGSPVGPLERLAAEAARLREALDAAVQRLGLPIK